MPSNMSSKKQQISTLLKGIETGDPQSVSVVNEGQYIQHNPLTRTGTEGLAELFKRLAKTNPRVEIIRIFEDGDYVFAHTDYDFNEVEVGFEVFRFESGLVVEHWDNLELKASGPNPAGHSMLDGPTEASDFEKTEENRALIRSFTEEVLVKGLLDRLEIYVDSQTYIEHHQLGNDGLAALRERLSLNNPPTRYLTIHRLLAEGSFVLCAVEGTQKDLQTSFYDLYRVADGKIVEHWNTIDEIPPRSQWVNDNGKF